MVCFYREYIWHSGKPLGVGALEKAVDEKIAYRVIADPYHKWITLEQYQDGKFFKVIYDSRFLDFRKLQPREQIAWRKEMIDETDAWIFNEDDRLILKESCQFETSRCAAVRIYSPYQTLICVYHMSKSHPDAFTLCDSNAHPVMKRYYCKQQKILKDLWHMQRNMAIE